MLNWKLADIPFSYAGSHLRIAGRTPTRSGRVHLGTSRFLPSPKITDRQWAHDFYELALFRGKHEVPCQRNVTPWQLELKAAGGQATLAFLDPDTLAFSVRGLTLAFLPSRGLPTCRQPSAGSVVLGDCAALCTHHFRVRKGARLRLETTLTTGGEKGQWSDRPHAVFVESGGEGAARFSLHDLPWEEPLPRFGETVEKRRREWEAWRRRFPEVPERYVEAAELATYVLWSAIVAPQGRYTRRAILMSKHWMNQVWSWDNCFNALAVAQADPELAFDQLRLMFDHQSPTGALPDLVNDLHAQYAFVKPPIYGWTILRLAERLGLRRLRPFLAEAYEPMRRQTEWWFARRDSDGDGMCEYHHGNDSGWDNATVFAQGGPVEGADLAAHLVLQMEGLAYMAKALGRPRDAAGWRRHAKEQLRRLLRHSVKNHRFFSPLSGKRSATDAQCLLNYVPAVLGPRLPRPILAATVKDLSPGGPYLTAYGLATQAPRSKPYKSNGYWRGPIWAPSTYLIFDGLARAGEKDLARLLAEHFCDMCVKDPGMWENFDALTGQGLCCPAYTWTAAVCLLLAEWLHKEGAR